MEILSSPRSVDPGELLIEEIERTAGVIDWLTARIGELDEDSEFVYDVVVTSKESGNTGQGYVDTTKTETRKEIHHYWKLLERERAHLANISTAAIRAGLEERRVRLAERSLNSLEAAMATILMDFGLDPHSDRVRQVVGSRLREALESGQKSDVTFLPAEEPTVLEGEVVNVKPVQF